MYVYPDIVILYKYNAEVCFTVSQVALVITFTLSLSFSLRPAFILPVPTELPD